MSVGGVVFGFPSRITARVRFGTGKLVDIDREVELGGPIHSKGVLILAGFIGAHYIPNSPLSLSASLVFEQCYSPVEGDSASCAELCAILSALAGIPLRQGIGVTGSINQNGEIQAVGGVNEKIEGFFEICKRRGFSGHEGVLIPKSNVQHLMLREEVVEAVAQKQFHIYAIEVIDDALEVLSGIRAGTRQADGAFPRETFNFAVEERLAQFATRAAALAKGKSD